MIQMNLFEMCTDACVRSGLIRYQLINSSEEIIFEAPNLEVAAYCCLLVSDGYHGYFGAQPVDGDGESVPVLTPNTLEEFVVSRLGKTVEEFVKSADPDVAAKCLDSFQCPLGVFLGGYEIVFHAQWMSINLIENKYM